MKNAFSVYGSICDVWYTKYLIIHVNLYHTHTHNLQCRRPGFEPWAGKIPWRRERLPTPVFWPGKFHGLYTPWGHKKLGPTEWLSLHFTHNLCALKKHFSHNEQAYLINSTYGNLTCSVQSLSHLGLFVTLRTAACQSSLSIVNSRSLLKLMSIESVMPSSHLILCHPLLLLPPIPPSIRVFSNESTLRMRWPKYQSFSFSISPSNEHPGLISLRMDWLDLLAVQGTFKSLLQHHSSKASILWHSAFFTVQLSHPYMTTGKTTALIRWTLVDKVMSLLFNMLSRLVMAFLPRSKRLLISWLQSPSAVILETPK